MTVARPLQAILAGAAQPSPPTDRHFSVAVQYQQDGGGAGPSPRIRNIAAAKDQVTGGAIHEPGAAAKGSDPAPEGNEGKVAATTETTRPARSAYLPLELGPAGSTETSPAYVASTESANARSTIATAKTEERPAWVAVAPPANPVARNSPTPAALAAVVEQATQISDRGFEMARRGMPFAGSAELTKALELIAQALDVQLGVSSHAAALASGLVALEESREFVSSPARPAAVDVAQVVLTHQTPVLKSNGATTVISPVVAQQQYFAFAQAQLAAAAGGLPVSSLTLYRLGKVQTALASQDADGQALHVPRAMVFHQAALAAHGGNALAAHELGVLMAKYGQLAQARELLVMSLAVQPQRETWQSLANIHHRLGEEDLARKAEYERDLLVGQPAKSRASQSAVQWVDPPTFARLGSSSSTESPWPTWSATGAYSASRRR